jgi:wobble nucleotide-excising tRNase
MAGTAAERRHFPLTEGEIELEFDESTKVSGAGLASTPLPQVRVFNRDFVSATLSSTGGIAPIYFIGEDSVEMQKEVDSLRNDLAVAISAATTALNKKAEAESRLDDFCRDSAKVIKELLTTANSQIYNNYDKRRFRQAAQSLSGQSAAASILSNERKASLRSQKDAQPKPDIAKVVAPSVDVAALTQEVEELLGRSVVAEALDELKSDAKLALWVQEGLALHSGEHASDSCRFCHQPLDPVRRHAIEAHFNDSFARFQDDLSALLSRLRRAKEGAGALGLPDSSRFYEAIGADATAALGAVSDATSATTTALDALIARVEGKRSNPFEPPPAVAVIAQPSASHGDSVAALNVIVDKHNKTSARFKASVIDACQRLEASYVGEAHAEYLQHSRDLDAASKALDGLKNKPEGIQKQLHALESQILELQRPADELTRELGEYLGRDELRFEVRGTGYALTRGGQPVSHLSEGERTAIAFLYFLKSLQDKTFNLAKGIVVIDDPVSSLDANALFSAFGYMKERTKKCGQLVIMTHSFAFFRLVKNWFHKGLERKQKPARFFLLRSSRHSDGSRTSHLGPLDRLLEEHESEYQYLFKRVHEAAHRNDVASLEQHYDLPNVARRLLETFLAFRYPDIHGNDRLHKGLGKVAFDESKKTRVLRLLNTYSHAGAIAEPEHDLSLLAETQPVLRDVLEMMKAVDNEHYQGLERLVNPEKDAA